MAANMNPFPFIILIVLCTFIITSHKQIIPIQQPKSFTLEVDQIYEQILPQFFDMYQAPSLTAFNTSQPALSPICKISRIKQSEFITNNIYYHYRLADPQKYFLGKKKIANFSDLAKLQGIIDVVDFGGQVVTLFQNGYYSVSSINREGKIAKYQVKLLYDQTNSVHENNYGPQVFKTAINYGDLIKSKSSVQHLLFVGEDKALLMNKTTKVFEDLNGYESLGIDFERAILVGNRVYVAMGFKGVFVYEVDFGMKTFKLIRKFIPKVSYPDSQVTLQVSDLVWDPVSHQLILTDLEQGLHWIPSLEDLTETSSLTPTFSLFLENCQNLHINDEEKVAVATCPELLIVNLTDKTHQIVDEIDFDAESLLVNESRIMVFGQYRYAVYDLQTNLVETGESMTKVDFSAIIENWVVTVNSLSISAGEIHPQQQKLMCHIASSTQLLGAYTANLTIEGICSQLYSRPMLCKTNQKSIFQPTELELQKMLGYQSQEENCFIVYTLNVDVQNSSQVSYWWQMLAAGVILWMLCAGLIMYCVKDVKVKKQYEELREEVNTGRDRATNTNSTSLQLFNTK